MNRMTEYFVRSQIRAQEFLFPHDLDRNEAGETEERSVWNSVAAAGGIVIAGIVIAKFTGVANAIQTP